MTPTTLSPRHQSIALPIAPHKDRQFTATLQGYEARRQQYQDRHKPKEERQSKKRNETLKLLKELGQGTIAQLRERAAARSIPVASNFAGYLQQLAREGRLYTAGDTPHYVVYSATPVNIALVPQPNVDRAIALVDRAGGGKTVRQLVAIDRSIPNLSIQLSKAVSGGRIVAEGTHTTKRYYTLEQWESYQEGKIALDADSLSPVEKFDRAIERMRSEGHVYGVRKLAKEFGVYPGFFQRHPACHAQLQQLRAELEPERVKQTDDGALIAKAIEGIETMKRERSLLSQAKFCDRFDLPSTFFKSHLQMREALAAAKASMSKRQPCSSRQVPTRPPKPPKPQTGIVAKLEPRQATKAKPTESQSRQLNDSHRAILETFRWKAERTTAEIIEVTRGSKVNLPTFDRALQELVMAGDLQITSKNPTRYKLTIKQEISA